MSTIKEVSRYASVSPSTVSRVLNGTAPVNAETKQRVLEAVAKLNYQPNTFARGLVTNRSGCIGVVVNEIASPFHSSIVQGIETVVEAQGMHLIVSSGHAKVKLERNAVNFLLQRRPDALIVHFDALSDADILQWLESEKVSDIPVVLIGRLIPQLAEVCVCLDNEYGGFLATQYLIDAGHNCIAHVSGPLSMRDGRDRLQGYRRALETAGLSFDERLVVEGSFTEESGHQAIKQLLERDLPITAIFVANDQMAAGVLHTLRQLKISVPKDISLIGYDDLLIARYLYPALTTIQQPLVAMGEAAAHIALEALEHKKVETTGKFEPKLIKRQSVKCRC